METDKRKIISVLELNRRAKHALEDGIGLVWVEGEISRLTRHASGHWYFTLKDAAASVSCAMFKANNQSVAFRPSDGVQVRVFAKPTLYEPRGNYQLMVMQMEEAGKGSLQEQFEKLKAKLQAEGLFDPARKRPIPKLPRCIGVVTSPTGAAIRDVLQVIDRRFPNVRVVLAPVTVQGPTAARSVTAAINYFNGLEPRKVGRASSRSIEGIHHFSPFVPVGIEQRHLPHWKQDGVTYFVTFRLADSLPREKLDQWSRDRAVWLQNHKEPYSPAELEEYGSLFGERINEWLDAGAGSCLLADKHNAALVEQALRHFDGSRYKLGSYVIMANHVHLLVTPLAGNGLSQITHSWKSFSANELNKVSGSHGAVWQDESYDHIVRGPDQLEFYETYIQKNFEQSNGTALWGRDRLEACPTLLWRPDVLIVGRGGGSLEDLWGFNEEIVARAIAASTIPVISAVGHEIDFTISDFVADLRAPTPSAAAELAVPEKAELTETVRLLRQRLAGSLTSRKLELTSRLVSAQGRLRLHDPQRLVVNYRQRLLMLQAAMRHALKEQTRYADRLESLQKRMQYALESVVRNRQQQLDEAQTQLVYRMEMRLQRERQSVARQAMALRALSPLAVLERGYSLTTRADGSVIRTAADVAAGDRIRTRVASGEFISTVERE